MSNTGAKFKQMQRSMQIKKRRAEFELTVEVFGWHGKNWRRGDVETPKGSTER